MVPRLVLGLVGAASSLWWCALVIDVADAVSGFIATSLGVTASDFLRSTLDTLLQAVEAGSVGMGLLMSVLYLIYGFFVLYVLIQMVLRVALIDILLALAPIALGLWILPHTANWGKQWLRTFMLTVFPASRPAHRPRLGLRIPERIREHRCVRGGAGPDLESCCSRWPSSTWPDGCRRCWGTRAPSTPGSARSTSACRCRARSCAPHGSSGSCQAAQRADRRGWRQVRSSPDGGIAALSGDIRSAAGGASAAGAAGSFRSSGE